ncbi:hypothetical protein AK822_09210 [Psychrobacter sp. P11F6]|nr:hypothetical protein AK822_09210 [Psychrobacter sp. P11F6]
MELCFYSSYTKDAINKNTVNEKHHKKDTMRVFFYEKTFYDCADQPSKSVQGIYCFSTTANA